MMRRFQTVGLALSALSVFAFGCSSESSGDGSKGSTTGESNGTTQVHARIGIAGLAGDVTAILFEVECDEGTTASAYIPLEEVLSPDFVTGGSYPFADFFQVLPGGAMCTITATPMQDPDTPSEDCEPGSTTIEVIPNTTTEIVLPIQCKGDGDSGAIDVVGIINRPPVITSLTLDPSKFLIACITGTVAVEATDPDGDPLTYEFTVVSTPDNAVYEFAANGNEFTFSAETPGTYIFEVTVTDPGGLSTSLQFPIHVQANPDCEHLDERCCRLPDGTLTINNAEICDELQGTIVPIEMCADELCCKTADGPQVVPAWACPQGGALPEEMCGPKVCCRFSVDGALQLLFVPEAQCHEPAAVVPDEQCKEVCCEIAGGPLLLPAAECVNGGGAPMPDDACNQSTCCRFADGTLQTVPMADCMASADATVEPPETCSQVVCCWLENSGAFTTIEECLGQQGAQIVAADQCDPAIVILDPEFTPDPEAPCEPAPRLVVPSTGNHRLAVFDTDTLQALPGSPFDTCSSPSRIIFDWNGDIIATCRVGNINVQKHQVDGTLLWTKELPFCTGGARGVTIAPNGGLFVLCSTPSEVHQLDHATGDVIASVPIQIPNYTSPHGYGLMSDSTGLYVADYFRGRLTKIDLATLSITWSVSTGIYGFSPDGQGIVWAGGPGGLKKIDAGDGSLLGTYPYPAGVGFTRGVQVSPDGFVYVGGGSQVVPKFDVFTDSYVTSLQTLPGDNNAVGVAVEFDNDLYAINYTSSTITKFPAGLQAGAQSFTTAGIQTLYAYSGDMTGVNLCQNGLVAEWFSPAISFDPQGTVWSWGVVTWAASTPPGTSVTMYYRLDGGAWTIINNGASIGAAGVTLELKAVLTAADPNTLPTLHSVSVQYTP